MKFERFEDIIAWQKSRVLTVMLYKIFGRNSDYNYRDQILRAGISTMNNIAEGFERRSNKEFKQFLFMSKGSAGEIRSMVILAHDLHYINDEVFSDLTNRSTEISKMLSGLIKTL